MSGGAGVRIDCCAFALPVGLNIFMVLKDFLFP